MAVVGPLRSGYGQDSRQDKRQGAANRVMGTPAKSPFSSPLMTYGQSSAKPAMGLSSGSAPRNPAPAVNPNQMDPGQVHGYLNSPGTPHYTAAQRNSLGIITTPLHEMSPEDRMQVARQHEAARGLGGVPLDQAASVFAGRRDAQAIINRSPQEIQQARLARTAQAQFSPLSGEASNFQAMNQATAADKAQKDAAWNTKMEDYKATKNADTNGNGIPDRDEAVATKYGNSGINSINDLAAVNAKYNVYMRGYKSNPEAMKSSRPMSFDEFAKANHADYNKRPVYGAEQSAGQQGGSPLLAAIQAGRQANQKARTEQQNSPAAQAVVAQRQNQVALTNLMGQAINMGYSQDQAAQIARNQMATNQQLANDQTVRNDAIGLEKLRQDAETGRTQIASDTQRHGIDTQGKVGLAGVDAQLQASNNALKGTMHTADQTLAGQQAGFAAQQGIAADTNATQKYITDANATSAENMAGIQTQAAERIKQIEASTQLSIAEKEAAVRREQIQAQSEIGRLQAEVQREIGVGQNEVGMAGVQAGERTAAGAQQTQRGIAELQAEVDNNRTQAGVGIASGNNASQERIAGLQGENNLAVGKQEIEGRLAELKAKANDPARRIELQMQIHQMNPQVIAQQAGQQEAADFGRANPNATLPEIQAAGSRASQSAFQQALPMWNAMQNDPLLGNFFSGVAGSPLTQGNSTTPGTTPPNAQSPLTAPPFDMTGGTGAPIVPGAGFNTAPVGTGGQIRSTEATLRKFLGRAPTRLEMEEQIRAEGGGYTLPPNWQPSVPNTFNSDGALDSNWMM